MERLTEKCGDRWIPRQDIRNNGHDKCMDRLAAYEDTGLTPEVIKDHEEMFKAYRHVCGGKSPEEIETLQRNLFNANEQISSMEDTNLRQADIIRSYRQAEEQGLLIKLPCKVGDVVFIIDKITGINRKCVTGVNCNNWNNDWYIQVGLFGTYHTSEFGKTVFLTREAAEEALRGGV